MSSSLSLSETAFVLLVLVFGVVVERGLAAGTELFWVALTGATAGG